MENVNGNISLINYIRKFINILINEMLDVDCLIQELLKNLLIYFKNVILYF